MPAVPTNPVPASSSTPIAAPQSVFGQGSFFERRTPQPAPITTVPTVSVAAKGVPTEESSETETSHVGSSTKADPLARFKKMPDFSKPRQ
jgi:hypothetical protein